MNRLDNLIVNFQRSGLVSLATQLQHIKKRSHEEKLVLLIFGEFNAGKTSLINNLLVSIKLQTSILPTTATIIEVHFGCQKCRVEVHYKNGNIEVVENPSSLKDTEFKDASVIKVYDTSTRVSSNIVLVDSPGLSSGDPIHYQALMNYLPKADGFIMVVDRCQSITKALIDFSNKPEISKRPLFLVFTKCERLPNFKKETKLDFDLPSKHVAYISRGNLSEFYQLLKIAQEDKYVRYQMLTVLKMKNWTLEDCEKRPWHSSIKEIRSIIIDDSVTYIGNHAFYGCSNLYSVILPDSVVSIGFDAFGGCSNLISITLPASLTSISERAFSGCSSLSSITIQNNCKCPKSFGDDGPKVVRK